MIKIVNKRTYSGPGYYIGRPSPLGNPFTHLAGRSVAEIRVGSRAEAISQFRPYLRDSLLLGGPVAEELKRLLRIYRENGELTLVCWCSPLPCHGDVIRDVILGASLSLDS